MLLRLFQIFSCVHRCKRQTVGKVGSVTVTVHRLDFRFEWGRGPVEEEVPEEPLYFRRL